MADVIALHDGTILDGVHSAENCVGVHCCIHNPSEHPLNRAPLVWMGEIRAMFRACPHDFAHPDPDDLAFHMLTRDFLLVEALTSVHLVEENCAGCCQRQPIRSITESEKEES